jgi:hypothetical protein
MVGLALLAGSVAACVATCRWWLLARQREGYSFNDRNSAIGLGGLGLLGAMVALQLLIGR